MPQLKAHVVRSNRFALLRPKIETERERDGRWIAEAKEVPGLMVYGVTELEVVREVCRVLVRMRRSER